MGIAPGAWSKLYFGALDHGDCWNLDLRCFKWIDFTRRVLKIQWWIMTGWWFGTKNIFFHISGIIIPTDCNFFRGVETTNQMIIVLFKKCFFGLYSIFRRRHMKKMQETTEYVIDIFSTCDVPLVLAWTPKNVPCVEFRFHLYLHYSPFVCSEVQMPAYHKKRELCISHWVHQAEKKMLRRFERRGDALFTCSMVLVYSTNIYPNKITQSWIGFRLQMLHVWNIYEYLPSYPRHHPNVGKYTSTMVRIDWQGFRNGSSHWNQSEVSWPLPEKIRGVSVRS